MNQLRKRCTVYRIVCTQCGARFEGGERYQHARLRAEDHARCTGHWGKVCLWGVGKRGESRALAQFGQAESRCGLMLVAMTPELDVSRTGYS